MPDIDLDFYDRDHILKSLTHRVATLENGDKHKTGVYFTEIPHNPLNSQSTINYKDAEERGYFKIDFLNVGIYKNVKDEQHLNELLKKEPLWELLEYKEFVDQLFHLSGHSELTKKLKPQNIEQLAAVLAIIRPSKRYLANSPWNVIEKEVWVKPTEGQYYFKKSHAIAYASAVVVHMNLLCDELVT